MIEILRMDLKPNTFKIGTVCVKYYDLVISCDICVYREEKIWIRMPEIWVDRKRKKQFVWWQMKEHSDKFQEAIIKSLLENEQLTLEKAVLLRRKFLSDRKEVTNKKKEIILSTQ